MAVNVFLETGGKLLADASISEVVSFFGADAFLGRGFFGAAFLGVACLDTGTFLGADAFLGVNFFGIFPKIRFVN